MFHCVTCASNNKKGNGRFKAKKNKINACSNTKSLNVGCLSTHRKTDVEDLFKKWWSDCKPFHAVVYTHATLAGL